uniref:Uncharacterized protein n=1 Tax=viral metagenome TaxID=1070528 RepID=A0A6M3JK15_9ZZZZ
MKIFPEHLKKTDVEVGTVIYRTVSGHLEYCRPIGYYIQKLEITTIVDDGNFHGFYCKNRDGRYFKFNFDNNNNFLTNEAAKKHLDYRIQVDINRQKDWLDLTRGATCS